MKNETCSGCCKEVSKYRDALGNICFTCSTCFHITEIDVRAEELFLDIIKQYPKLKNIYFKHKFKKHTITFDI